jgi:hypothetical protein
MASLRSPLPGRRFHGPCWPLTLATKDWHLPADSNGGHFSDNPDYVSTWPAHCVQGTDGALFDPYIAEVAEKFCNLNSGAFVRGRCPAALPPSLSPGADGSKFGTDEATAAVIEDSVTCADLTGQRLRVLSRRQPLVKPCPPRAAVDRATVVAPCLSRNRIDQETCFPLPVIPPFARNTCHFVHMSLPKSLLGATPVGLG